MSALTDLTTLYSEVEKAVILLVDDEEVNTAILRNALTDFGRTYEVHSGDEAISFCKKHPPDLVILDVQMPELDGLTTCKLLKTMPEMANCPIIFSTSLETVEDELRCWEAGGADFIPKPVVSLTLIKRIHSHVLLKLKSDMRDNLAFYDNLTDLRNRRYFDDIYTQQINLAKRNSNDLAMLVIDIDYFKHYNDFYGHQQGDKCLTQVAEIISAELHRPTDIAIRYSGGKFVVMLPDTNTKGAKRVGEGIVAKIFEANLAHVKSPFDVVTISLGVSSLNTCGEDENLFKLADTKLCSAKDNGRNACAA